MRLPFDQNLSPRLVDALADLFPGPGKSRGSQHVANVGLDRATDLEIIEYARSRGFTIVTKGADFSDLRLIREPYPNFVSDPAPTLSSTSPYPALCPTVMGNDRASEEGAALRFACVAADATNEREVSRQVTDLRLYDTLADATAACADGERVLVVEGDGSIPNRSPYLRPEPVTAAGGFVVREGGGGPEVLLIFRRGAWDLPKGKLDPGETVDECALREVREEVGIGELALTGPAGTTVHGYPEGDRYLVKTTHWYFMRTPERDFTPEEREGIEQVTWVPWEEAEERLGYESLRRHIATLRPPE